MGIEPQVVRPLVLALALAAGGCGGSPLGGGGSIQIAAERAIRIRLGNDGWWLGDSAVFLRDVDGVGTEVWRSRLDGQEPEILDRGYNSATWFIRDDAGTPRSVAVAGQGIYSIAPLDGQPRMVIGMNRAVDTSLGVLGLDRCMTVSLNSGVIGAGPCNYVTVLTSELVARDLIDGGDGHAIVTAARYVGDQSVLGIYDVAPDGTVTQLVPPALGDFDVPPGFTPPAALVSRSVSPEHALSRDCWNGHCHLLYMRVKDDGGLTQFAYMFDTGKEVALPGDAWSYQLWSRWLRPQDPRLVLWGGGEDVPGSLAIGAWNLETGAAELCRLAIPLDLGDMGVQARDDGGAILIQAGVNQPAGFVVVPASADGCGRFQDAYQPRFSPGGASIVWIQATTAQIVTDAPWEVWMSDGLGRNAHVVANLPNLYTADLVSPDTLLVRFGVLDGTVLASLDPNVAGATPRPLAGQVFGGFRLVGQRKLLTGTDVSADDGNGNLSLIDLDSGEKQVLAGAVAWFDATPDAVIYTVHGRYASSADGLWVRRLP